MNTSLQDKMPTHFDIFPKYEQQWGVKKSPNPEGLIKHI